MRTRSILLWIGFLLWVATAPAPVTAAPARQDRRQVYYLGGIAYGERVEAELTPEGAAHVWEFEGVAGDEILIAMDALEEELDPYLLLLAMSEGELEEFLALSDEEVGVLDAVAEERGLLLDLDDGGGGNLNSLIPSFVLPEDGRYFIVATSCCTAGSSGAYELTLQLQPPQARRVEYAGLIGYGERVEAELTPEGAAHVWEFEGGAGDEILIAMDALEEELDPYLLLLAMSEGELEEFLALSDEEVGVLDAVAEERGLLLDLDDGGGGNLNSLIPSFVLPEDGRYFIVVTSCCTAGSSGLYELALELIGEPEPTPTGEPPPEDVETPAVEPTAPEEGDETPAVEPTAPEEGNETPAVEPTPQGPLFPDLLSVSPREGRAGSEVTLALQGEGFSELGQPTGVAISGVSVLVVAFETVNDQLVEVTIEIPSDAPAGEQEIAFLFENGGFDSLFTVLEAIGEPDVTAPEPTARAPTSTGDRSQFPLVLILGGGLVVALSLLLLVVAGLVVWPRVRPPKPEPPPKGEPPEAPQPPPDLHFETERDLGTQRIGPANQPIKASIDIRFELDIQHSVRVVEEGAPGPE